MKVLVVGGGGREHALCYFLYNSKYKPTLYATSANAGILQLAQDTKIEINTSGYITKIKEFIKEEGIDLVVVGPEGPLADGIVDELSAVGVITFGPTKAASQLEASKAYAKLFMQRYNIPTPEFAIFSDPSSAINYVKSKDEIVVKADGLCAGKGSFVCNSAQEAQEAIQKIMVDREFGQAGECVVCESREYGSELTVMVLVDSDSGSYRLLPAVEDYKRRFDGDRGPNTGGMGAHSPPTSGEKNNLINYVETKIVVPTVKGIISEGFRYRGILYIGLIVTDSGPKVLEYNVRFGDPEAQVALPRLKVDLLEVIEYCSTGKLAQLNPIKYSEEAYVDVVLVSSGYPGKYEIGKEIKGLDDVDEDILIFHAGTKSYNHKILTSGGRVLNIVGCGKTLHDARQKVYKNVGKIYFEGMEYRKDIGKRYRRYQGIADTKISQIQEVRNERMHLL